ncbi:MAG: DUF4296 domain-containing protein [Prevotella sp.]|nr:DUF4296 domain-containing protein [Prevotella sp.]
MRSRLLIAFCILSALMSCKPSVPDEFLRPGELEDVLYDLHLAQGVAHEVAPGDQGHVDIHAYRLAVFRKHGITEGQFEASMNYYYRHTDRMHDIYENLAKRFTNEAKALGVSGNELLQYTNAMRGDTTDIWTAQHDIILIPEAPYNRVSYDIKADSSFHKGDRIMLSLDAQFIMQEGIRDGVAMLCVEFANDSVATTTRNMTANSNYSMFIDDRDNLGISSVKGFIFLGNGNGESRTTVKLLSASNIHLLKIHKKEEADDSKQGEPNDSASVRRDTGADSTSVDTEDGKHQDGSTPHPEPPHRMSAMPPSSPPQPKR